MVDIVNGFCLDIVQKIGIVWVYGVGKYEILLYYNVVFIGQVIKEVRFINIVVLNVYYIYVGSCYVFKYLLVMSFCGLVQKIVLWDIVGFFGEQRLFVDFKMEVVAFFVGFLYELYSV